MFKFYHRASLVLTALVLLAYLAATRRLTSTGWGAQIELLLFMAALALAFAHSAIVSLVYLLARKDAEGRWAMLVHGVFIVVVALPFMAAAVRESIGGMRYRASPEYKMGVAIESGTLDAFQRQWQRAQKLDRVGNPSGALALEQDWASRAAEHGRLDILQALKTNGSFKLDAQSQDRLTSLVFNAAVCEDDRCRTARLPLVQWLLAEATPHGLTLKPASQVLFDGFTFSHRYDLSDPQTVQMLESFIAHGADLNDLGRNGALWYSARFNKIEHVKFLLNHGLTRASINRVEEDDNSALGEALASHAPEIVELLLAAGAVPQHAKYRDDLVIACRDTGSDDEADARRGIEALKRHGARLSKAQLAAILDERGLSDTETQCLREFVK